MTNQVCNNITVTLCTEFVIRQLFPELFMIVDLSIHLVYTVWYNLFYMLLYIPNYNI
jgi:hypothetical protein